MNQLSHAPLPKTSGIYEIVCVANGRRYVGSAVNIRKRHKEHFNDLKANRHTNQHLQNIHNKHGAQSLAFNILEFCPIESLIEREQYYIDMLNPEINVCRTAGNTLGVKRTEEAKRRISEANKGRKPSEETRAKMREMMLGRVFSDEHRKKISEANKRRPPASEETRRRNSEAQKNRPPTSEETRRKISEAGKRRPPASEETRRKLSEANKGKKRTEETLRKSRMAIINRSPEERARIREALQNRPPISEETRKKMSEANKRRPPASDETRRKMSEYGKGRPKSAEHRAKIAESNRKYPVEVVKAHLQAWLESGLAKAVYARAHGINASTLSKWWRESKR